MKRSIRGLSSGLAIVAFSGTLYWAARDGRMATGDGLILWVSLAFLFGLVTGGVSYGLLTWLFGD